MTKQIRVENADNSDYRVVVQIWDSCVPENHPHTLVSETFLNHPCAMTGPEAYITATRYLVIKEVPRNDL